MAKTFPYKKNNAVSTLKSTCAVDAETLVIQDGDGSKFPTTLPFMVTLFSDDPATGEIVKVTSIATSTTFSITREQEGTSAQEWAADSNVQILITAGQLDDYQTRTEIIVATDGSGDYNCNGSSDETEINEAIAALPATGGIVHLKKGTYTIDGSISILKSGVTLEGEGPGTIIYADDSTDLSYLIGVSDGGTVITDVIIKDLYVDGNQANQSTGNSSPIVLYGHSSYILKRISVINCWLTGALLDCLKIIQAEECVIKGNHIFSNTGCAIFNNHDYNTIIGNTSYANEYLYYGSVDTYNTISDNISRGDNYGIYLSGSTRNSITGNIINPTTAGIYLIGCERVNVTGNNIYAGSYGIMLGNSASSTQRNTISGNTFAYQTYRSIWLNEGSGGCLNNSICGNSIYGPGQQGIRIYGSQYNSVVGNTIAGASRTTNNTYDSIILESGSTHESIYNIISNNNCIAQQANKARYHINEADSSQDYQLIIGNICTAGVTAQIREQGTNTVRGTNIPSSG